MLSNKEKIINKMISKSDGLWSEIRDYNEEIIIFLGEGEETENSSKLLAMALKLVLCELILNKKIYKKYNIKGYTSEEFVKLLKKYTIEYMSGNMIEKENSEKLIKKTRKILWGYIKKHYKILEELLLSLNKGEKIKSEEEYNCLLDCLCIVFIENSFREKELCFLEEEVI